MSNPEEQSHTAELWIPAMRRRLLLAIYFDWIIFSVPWAFVFLALQSGWPAIAESATTVKLLTFGALELLFHRVVRKSPGNYLLGIRYLHPEFGAVDGASEQLRPYVRADIKQGENWSTLLLATLLLVEGLKSMVRWTMWTPPIPAFGMQLSEPASAAFLMLMGAIECGVAVLLFRLRRGAFYIGLPFLLTALVSTIMSWSFWGAWVAASVERRRAWQGLPVREGEIEFMQRLFPEAQIGWLALLLILLVIAHRTVARHRRHESGLPSEEGRQPLGA